jgi:hypothetical protein
MALCVTQMELTLGDSAPVALAALAARPAGAFGAADWAASDYGDVSGGRTLDRRVRDSLRYRRRLKIANIDRATMPPGAVLGPKSCCGATLLAGSSWHTSTTRSQTPTSGHWLLWHSAPTRAVGRWSWGAGRCSRQGTTGHLRTYRHVTRLSSGARCAVTIAVHRATPAAAPPKAPAPNRRNVRKN